MKTFFHQGRRSLWLLREPSLQLGWQTVCGWRLCRLPFGANLDSLDANPGLWSITLGAVASRFWLKSARAGSGGNGADQIGSRPRCVWQGSDLAYGRWYMILWVLDMESLQNCPHLKDLKYPLIGKIFVSWSDILPQIETCSLLQLDFLTPIPLKVKTSPNMSFERKFENEGIGPESLSILRAVATRFWDFGRGVLMVSCV